MLARDAEVQLLALTHVSTRYGPREIREEAEAVFANTVVPRDFDLIDIPFPERGPPLLQRWDEDVAARCLGCCASVPLTRSERPGRGTVGN